jgi:hypothetical protein
MLFVLRPSSTNNDYLIEERRIVNPFAPIEVESQFSIG